MIGDYNDLEERQWRQIPCDPLFASEPLGCRQCGASIPEEQSLYKLCKKCEQEAWERFRYLMLNEFTDAEREFLDGCIDGKSLTDIEEIKPTTAIY